jgi:tetratricopeptide (TPR) repeat protein
MATDEKLWEKCIEAGELAGRRGRHDVAEKHFREACRLAAAFSEGDERRARCAALLGHSCSQLDKGAEAEALLRQAVAQWESAGQANAEMGLALGLLGTLCARRARFAEADVLLRRALPIVEQELPANHMGRADILSNLAQLCYSHGSDTDTESFLGRLLTLTEHDTRVPAQQRFATGLRLLGQLYERQGKAAQAEPLLRQSQAVEHKLRGKVGATPAVPADGPQSSIAAGIAAKRAGRFEEAERCFRTAAARADGAPRDLIGAWINLGGVLVERAKFAEAEEVSRRALALSEQEFTPDSLEVCYCLNHLALACEGLEKYDEAALLLERAVALSRPELPAYGAQPLLLRNLDRVKQFAAPQPWHDDLRLARQSEAAGDLEGAATHFRAALVLLEQGPRVGSHARDMLACLISLGRLGCRQGRPREAGTFLDKALPLATSGAEARPKLALAETLTRLGSLHAEAQQHEDAERCRRQSLALRQSCLPPMHQELAQGQADLGASLQALGRRREAEQAYERALNICKRLPSGAEQAAAELREQLDQTPGHPLDQPFLGAAQASADLLEQLGWYHAAWNRPGDAEAFFQKSLALRQRQNGTDPVDVAWALVRWADWARHLASRSQAGPLYEQAIAIWSNRLPAARAALAAVCQALAELRQGEGRGPAALALLERALALHRGGGAALDPQGYGCAERLADACVGASRFAEAEQLYREVLTWRESTVEQGAPALASLVSRLGLAAVAAGNLAEGEVYQRRALALWESRRGPDHADAATAAARLGQTLTDLGRPAEAEAMLTRALHVLQDLVQAHPARCDYLDALAEVCQLLGRHDEAADLCGRALAVDRKASPCRRARRLLDLARLHETRSNPALALRCCQQALDLVEQAAIAEGPELASLLHELGTSLHAHGKYALAKGLLRRALRLREQWLGMDHPDVAASLDALADLHASQGRAASAEPLYQRALAIREGQAPAAVSASLYNLGMLYYTQGRHAEAEPLLRRSLSLIEKEPRPNPLRLGQHLDALAAVLQETGRHAEAAPIEDYARSLRAGRSSG